MPGKHYNHLKIDLKTVTRSKPDRETFPSPHLPLWYLHRPSFVRGSQGGRDGKRRGGLLVKLYNSKEEHTAQMINVLFANLQNYGPVRTEFSNYVYIGGHVDQHHCHITDSIIAVWQEDPASKTIAILYIGERENARYNRVRTKLERDSVVTKAVAARDTDQSWAKFWNKKAKPG
ncbi:MAG: hypothetical protein KBD64_03335 [Gammaproteobacteria bacterium]|nr:hypothetical protein [Gammaproteobacteria bacterium]